MGKLVGVAVFVGRHTQFGEPSFLPRTFSTVDLLVSEVE